MKKMGCTKCGKNKMSEGGSTSNRLKRLSQKIDKKTEKGKSISSGLTKRYDKAVDKVIAKGIKKMKEGGPTEPRIYGIPQIGGTGPGFAKVGGSFAPNRAVQASCKGGMVRDENGRCVMQRKMAKGGSTLPDFSKDGEITQKDVLMGRGVIPKAKKGGNWIQGAIKKPGALRESLGVKKGEKIPKGKLQAAAKKGGKLGQRARLAITLSKMRKG